MPNAQEAISSLNAEQLPQYLTSLGLKPQQVTAVIYGIFREVKQLQTLSPAEDNSIHITKEKILSMAKDPSLESDLYALFSKVQKSKSLEVIFQTGSKTDSLVAPDIWHNPHGTKANLPDPEDIPETVEVLDFVKFLSGCGIDPMVVKKAMEEKELLKGGK